VTVPVAGTGTTALMTTRIARISLAALAAGALALLALALATETRNTASAQGAEFTIELLDSGPNPALCIVNRNDSRVYFLNRSSKPRRILGGNPQIPNYDSGTIEPGQRSAGPIGVNSQVLLQYWDSEDESYRGVIEAPMSHNAQSFCSPLAPTPTPTPKPPPSPTVPATPVVRHPKCTGLIPGPWTPIQGCSVAPGLATDGPGAP
jgi:hypothetical protein